MEPGDATRRWGRGEMGEGQNGKQLDRSPESVWSWVAHVGKPGAFPDIATLHSRTLLITPPRQSGRLSSLQSIYFTSRPLHSVQAFLVSYLDCSCPN